MKIVGIRNPEPLRDFLYDRMRGARAETEDEASESSAQDEALNLLGEIRDALKGLRNERKSDR